MTHSGAPFCSSCSCAVFGISASLFSAQPVLPRTGPYSLFLSQPVLPCAGPYSLFLSQPVLPCTGPYSLFLSQPVLPCTGPYSLFLSQPVLPCTGPYSQALVHTHCFCRSLYIHAPVHTHKHLTSNRLKIAVQVVQVLLNASRHSAQSQDRLAHHMHSAGSLSVATQHSLLSSLCMLQN